LLDRLLIIKTLPYSVNEIVQILSIRCSTESIEIEEDALAHLAAIGSKTSLRYAVQLITPANILAETDGRDKIVKDDIDDVNMLFFDAKSSAKILQEQADKFIS
jgi:RuvB-like protein 1